jgi:putative methyltransferase (TIGR04325 family)
MIKEALRAVSPPFLVNLYKRATRRYGWFGNYESWQAAVNDTTGYDSNVILLEVKNSLLKVKHGDAVFERDSVLFNRIEYSWPLLAGIMWIAAQNRGTLSVLDFGGSLGSTYFQNRAFLKDLDRVEWNIVEQDNFVKEGRENFQSEELKFFFSIEELQEVTACQVIILSAVLPYIEKPFELLNRIMGYNIEYIILDRMPMIIGEEDRITLQRVTPEIYKASYPAWFFSEIKFLKFLNQKYDLIEQFDCADKANIPSVFKGYIFRLRK